MGVWIEIISAFVSRKNINVTPRAGVWIEIANTFTTDQVTKVTPRAGVWIEIFFLPCPLRPHMSLPVRECGLK